MCLPPTLWLAFLLSIILSRTEVFNFNIVEYINTFIVHAFFCVGLMKSWGAR